MSSYPEISIQKLQKLWFFALLILLLSKPKRQDIFYEKT